MPTKQPSPLAALLLLSSLLGSEDRPPSRRRRSAPAVPDPKEPDNKCQHCGGVHDDEFGGLADLLREMGPPPSKREVANDHKFLAVHDEMFGQLSALLNDHPGSTIDEIYEFAGPVKHSDPVGKYILFMIEGGVQYGWINRMVTTDGSELFIYEMSDKFKKFIDVPIPGHN